MAKIILSIAFILSFAEISFGSNCFISKSQVKSGSKDIDRQTLIVCVDINENRSELSIKKLQTQSTILHLSSHNGVRVNSLTAAFTLPTKAVKLRVFDEPGEEGDMGLLTVIDFESKTETRYFLRDLLDGTDT